MPLNKSPLAYGDCTKVLDRALVSEKGIKVTFPTHREAKAFQYRAMQARRNDRITNATIYPKGEPMHAKSAYDYLCVSVRENIIIIEKVAERDFNIEEM